MNNFVQQGWTETVVAPYNVASGGGCKVGNKFGISAYTVTTGQSTEISNIGIYDLGKDTSTFVDGDHVYWDNTNFVATSNVSGNLRIGVAALAVPDGSTVPGGSSGDATVRVRLIPGFAISGNAAVGLGSLNVAHAIYDFTVDGGASCTPVSTVVIPANAILIGATTNSTVAVTAAGSATVAIGTTAGSSGSSILTATGKASFTLDAVVNGTVTLAAPIKMTAAGSINVTIATGPLTAGKIEIFVYYVVALGA